MSNLGTLHCTAFAGEHRIATGNALSVARAVKAAGADERPEPILIFDDATAQPIEIDFRGTIEKVIDRLERRIAVETPPEITVVPAAPSVGRPKLGVVAREVTLLPRHWEWLGKQTGGASVALRKLVEDARRVGEGKDRIRQAREAAYRFMSAMAGNQPGFEEATRALFAGDAQRFQDNCQAWPADIRDHARQVAAASFGSDI